MYYTHLCLIYTPKLIMYNKHLCIKYIPKFKLQNPRKTMLM